MTAEPMATPLVMALVVLPTASKSANTVGRLSYPCPLNPTRPFHQCHLRCRNWDQRVHRHVITGQSQHADAGHRHAIQDECGLADRIRTGMVPKMKMEATMVRAMTSTDQTEDSKPAAIPFRIRVAGPVSAAFLMLLTGAACVPVKYSV